MTSYNRNEPITIRRAKPEDVESILNLLTEYGLLSSYFEPFYLNDTSYRPEQSWIVEQNGQIVSHLRIYDRWIRIGRAKLHIAGIGNVITTFDARGRGYAGRLIRAMLSDLHQEGFAYSLLWTHLPDLYSRYGWVAIEQELVRAVLLPSVLGTVRVAPFRHEDLPAIMRLYEAANAERTGTIIRTPEYWREQPTWLHEDKDGFLVAHANAEEVLVGYVRSRATQDAVEVLELGIEGDSFDIGRTLLTVTSLQHNGRLQGQFPPSLRAVFLPGKFEIIRAPELMGRVINFAELRRTLEPIWRDRVLKSGEGEGSICLSTSAGRAQIRVSKGNLQIDLQDFGDTVPFLNESEFAYLLFFGFNDTASTLFGHWLNTALLQILFPVQDFVIWQADAF